MKCQWKIRLHHLIFVFYLNYLQATNYTKDPSKPQAEEAVIHRIRITLTSRNVKSLEKGGWSHGGNSYFILDAFWNWDSQWEFLISSPHAVSFLNINMSCAFQCATTWWRGRKRKLWRWKGPSECPQRFWGLRPVKLLVVKVPKLGTGN